jgi:hypothetical protein
MRADASFALRERGALCGRFDIWIFSRLFVTPFLLVPAFYVRHLGSGVVVEVFLATIEESLDMCKLVFFLFLFCILFVVQRSRQTPTHK